MATYLCLLSVINPDGVDIIQSVGLVQSFQTVVLEVEVKDTETGCSIDL